MDRRAVFRSIVFSEQAYQGTGHQTGDAGAKYGQGVYRFTAQLHRIR